MTNLRPEVNNGSRASLFYYNMYTVLLCSLKCTIFNYIMPIIKFNIYSINFLL